MTVYSSGMNHRSYTAQITVVCFVLGLILAAAWHTVSQVSRSGVAAPVGFSFGEGGGTTISAKKLLEDEDEIKHLRAQNQKINDQLSKRNGATGTMNQELKDARMFAGLTEVTGPGVQITLTDSLKRETFPNDPLALTNLIHDRDIAEVVNELKIAGADAVAVNGQRITNTSTFRCIGPVVQINGLPAAAPYVILAIGDQNAMFGGLNLPDGVLDQIRRMDRNMVRIERKAKLHLPAYAGSTRMRFARTPKNSESDTSKDNN